MAVSLVKTKTPGVYKRGDRYVVIWRHRGKQHKAFFRTYAEAREEKGKRDARIEGAPASKEPFDKYARAWVMTCQGRTRRGFDEHTRQSYAAAIEIHLIPHFGSVPLREIDRKDVNALIAALQAKGLSPASIAKYVAPLRAMLGDAVENSDLATNPALGLKINQKARRAAEARPERVKEMTRADLAAVLAAIPEQHRLAFELMAYTGCRISEALGLEWRDVDFGEPPRLRISRQWYQGQIKTPKTKAGIRTVELPKNLASKLWELGADATGPILHTRTGGRLSANNLRRTLTEASRQACVPGVTHHSFRHTHGSILLDEGWTIAEVAERLGHASPAITAAVYAHKMRDRRRDLGFLDNLRKDDEEVPQPSAQA